MGDMFSTTPTSLLATKLLHMRSRAVTASSANMLAMSACMCTSAIHPPIRKMLWIKIMAFQTWWLIGSSRCKDFSKIGWLIQYLEKKRFASNFLSNLCKPCSVSRHFLRGDAAHFLKTTAISHYWSPDKRQSTSFKYFGADKFKCKKELKNISSKNQMPITNISIIKIKKWIEKFWKKFGCCWKEDKYFVVFQRSVTRFFSANWV